MAIPEVQYRKARRSTPNDNCVAIAFVGDEVWVRHSKEVDGLVLKYAKPDWAALVRGLPTDTSAGVEFSQGGVLLRHPHDLDGPAISFTLAEWVAFQDGMATDTMTVPVP